MIANQLKQLPDHCRQFLPWAKLLIPRQQQSIKPLIAPSYSPNELTKIDMWVMLPFIEQCSAALAALLGYCLIKIIHSGNQVPFYRLIIHY
ncbi:MAG TPA: hypothetical protein ACHBX0_04700 [Arsenophonus sp.]